MTTTKTTKTAEAGHSSWKVRSILIVMGLCTVVLLIDWTEFTENATFYIVAIPKDGSDNNNNNTTNNTNAQQQQQQQQQQQRSNMSLWRKQYLQLKDAKYLQQLLDNSSSSVLLGTSKSNDNDKGMLEEYYYQDNADELDEDLQKMEDMETLEKLDYIPLPEPLKARPDIGVNNKKDINQEVFFHVREYIEGMASWRNQLGDVLDFGKRYLNATFVEPCIQRGRLGSCQDKPSAVKLSQVYDLSSLQQRGYRFVSHEDFVKLTNYSLTDPKLPNLFRLACNGGSNNICTRKKRMNQGDELWNTEKFKAVLAQGPVILELGKTCRRCLAASKEAELATASMQLHRFYFDFVQSTVLARAGIGKNTTWGAIQYRPEGNNRPFMECAQHVLATRDMLSAKHGIQKENFFVVSPLSRTPELMWGGMRHTSDANPDVQKSLSLLLDSGMKKMEIIYPGRVQDEIVLFVFDLVFAQMSTAFATCSGCKADICNKCAHMGRSAAYTLFVRSERFHGNKKDYREHTEQCYA